MNNNHLEAEQSVIGALLLNANALDSVSDILTAASFWDAAHRKLFSTIEGMVLKGTDVDVLTVSHALENAGVLDSVGGLAYIVAMVENTPSTANVRHYARIVADKAIERSLLAATNKIAEIVESGIPTGEKVDQAQAAISEIAETRQDSEPVDMRAALMQTLNAMDERMAAGGALNGLSTGLVDLDAGVRGMRPGQLIVIAGRPSMGKTSLAMQIAEHVADTAPVLIFSLEMPTMELTSRMLSGVAKINLEQVLSGNIREEQWPALTHAISRIQDKKIHIVDASILTVMTLRAQARRMKRKHGLGLIVVDYLQLMTHNKQDDNTGLTDISRGLKLIAKELGVPVIALSQLNRDCEKRPNKRPIMSDLRASGAIEQDADIVMMVYRDEVYETDTDRKGIAELLLRKNRNGPLGNVITTFMGEFTRFGNYAGPPISEESSGSGSKGKRNSDFL
jgi:replicative DNA helicase